MCPVRVKLSITYFCKPNCFLNRLSAKRGPWLRSTAMVMWRWTLLVPHGYLILSVVSRCHKVKVEYHLRETVWQSTHRVAVTTTMTLTVSITFRHVHVFAIIAFCTVSHPFSFSLQAHDPVFNPSFHYSKQGLPTVTYQTDWLHRCYFLLLLLIIFCCCSCSLFVLSTKSARFSWPSHAKCIHFYLTYVLTGFQ